MIITTPWLQTGDQIRSILLRQVPGGYVFRAPNPKVFGDSDHYLVNEAQRDEIVAIMTPRRPLLMLTLWSGGFVLAAIASLVLAPGYPATVSLVVIAAMVLAAILGLHLSAARKLRRLQPILAGAARTDQRITLADISRTLNHDNSYQQMRRLGMSNAFACLAAVAGVAARVYAHKPGVGILSDPLVLLLCLAAITTAATSASAFHRALHKKRQEAAQRGAPVDGTVADASPIPGAAARRLGVAWPYALVICVAVIAGIAVKGEFSDDSQGLRYEAKGDHDNAIASFSSAIAAEPGNALAYRHRASSYDAKGDHDRAIADYAKAIAIGPGDAAIYRNRGDAFREKGDHDHAIADYDKSIALDPDNAFTYYVRGISHDASKNGDRAIADFTRAIEINPRDGYAYAARARAFEAKGDHDRAIADFGKAIEIHPKEAYNYYTLARIFEARGQHGEADADFAKAIAADPRSYYAYYFRGHALKARGEHDRAIADLTKAIEINPSNVYSYVSRAQGFEAKGEHGMAIADYKAILDLPADDDAGRRTQAFARQRIAELTSASPAARKLP
jgi:tetratricopeptide (TPR) repeat protein